jgi:proton-dependent oligopeptide transporter, POT family
MAALRRSGWPWSAAIWGLIQFQEASAGCCWSFGGLRRLCDLGGGGQAGADDRDRIFAAMFLIFGSILFWALFEQAGSSLNLFTDRTSIATCSAGVPAAMFQSINPIYIILLAPLFAWLWTWLGAARAGALGAAKFGLGMIQLGRGLPGAGGRRLRGRNRRIRRRSSSSSSSTCCTRPASCACPRSGCRR